MIDEHSPYYKDPNRITVIRHELWMLGIDELTSPKQVDEVVKSGGTVLMLVNSDDECGADQARPAAALAMQHSVPPDRTVFVFAGQEIDTVARARSYFTDYFPTSPQLALLKDGTVVHMCDRDDMLRLADPEKIAAELTQAIDQHAAG